MSPKKVCFICGTDKELIHKKGQIQELFSSTFVHPLFPISQSELTSSQVPYQDIRICKGCSGLLVGIQEREEEGPKEDANDEKKDKFHNKFQEMMRKVRLSKTKFDRRASDDSLLDLRDKIMYPCDFGSSNFGFSNEEVAGEFGKLPDEMLDKIFSYLDPTSLKNVRQVSSFFRTKSMTALHLISPIQIDKWNKDDELLTWPHLFRHRNFVLDTSRLRLIREWEKRVEKILEGCGDAVKKLELNAEIFGNKGETWFLNYVVPILKNLDSLKISVKIRKNQVQVPNWEQIFGPSQRLKVVTFSRDCAVPGLKEFMKATRGVRTLNLGRIYKPKPDDWINELIKALKNDYSLWPNLESFSFTGSGILGHTNRWNKEFLECLGPRPIREVDITIGFNMLDTFVQFLQKYGDTLESVGVTLSLGFTDAWRKPFKELELPSNLGKLKAFKFLLDESHLIPDEGDKDLERCKRCKYRTEGFGGGRIPPFKKRGGKKWDFSRDFFNFGKLLKDPELFAQKFPNLLHLSLITYPSTNVHPIKCESCMKVKKAICEDFIPQGAFNPRLVTLQCSYPTREEGEGLYEEWRERLRAAFPNAGII